MIIQYIFKKVINMNKNEIEEKFNKRYGNGYDLDYSDQQIIDKIVKNINELPATVIDIFPDLLILKYILENKTF